MRFWTSDGRSDGEVLQVEGSFNGSKTVIMQTIFDRQDVTRSCTFDPKCKHENTRSNALGRDLNHVRIELIPKQLYCFSQPRETSTSRTPR